MFYLVLFAFVLQFALFLGLAARASANGGTGPVDRHEGGGPFTFLEALDPELVAAHLYRQEPATAAGVLAAMDPGFAELVVDCWPSPQVEALIDRIQRDGALAAAAQRSVAARLRRDLGVPPGQRERKAARPTRAPMKPPRRVKPGIVDAWERCSSANGPLVVTAFVLEFAVALGENYALGGTALNGKVVAGRYFVGEHRNYFEVSAATFSLCKALECASLVFLFATIAYGAIHLLMSAMLRWWASDGGPSPASPVFGERGGWIAAMALQGVLAILISAGAAVAWMRLFQATDHSRGLIPAILGEIRSLT